MVLLVFPFSFTHTQLTSPALSIEFIYRFCFVKRKRFFPSNYLSHFVHIVIAFTIHGDGSVSVCHFAAHFFLALFFVTFPSFRFHLLIFFSLCLFPSYEFIYFVLNSFVLCICIADCSQIVDCYGGVQFSRFRSVNLKTTNKLELSSTFSSNSFEMPLKTLPSS